MPLDKRERKPLAFALAMALPMLAQSGERKWEASGFGTVGLAATNTHQVGYFRDTNQPPDGVIDHPNAKVDSRLGLQLNYQFSDTLRGTLQGVSTFRHDGTFKPDLTWAFLSWNPVGDLQVRAGRLGLEQILGTDSRDVGYAYLWVRPSVEVFGLNALNFIDGADLIQTVALGPRTTLRAKAYYGQAFQKLPIGDGPPYDLGGTKVYGLNVDLRHGHWQARLSHSQARARNSWPGLVGQVVGTLNTYATLLNDPRLTQSARALDAKDAQTKIWVASVLWEEGPIQGYGVLSRSRGDRPVVPDNWSGLMSFGYRLGRFVPYGSVSRVVSSREPAPELGALPYLPDALPKLLVQGINGLLYLRQADQTTVAAGCRWDFRDNADLKFQVDQVRTWNALSTWHPIQPGWNGKALVFTVTLDFVFGRGH